MEATLISPSERTEARRPGRQPADPTPRPPGTLAAPVHRAPPPAARAAPAQPTPPRPPAPPAPAVEQPAPPGEATEAPPPPRPDLDDPGARARWGREAAVLRNALFPSQLVRALRLESDFSDTGARLFLLHFRQESGQPRDAVEAVLVGQLALAHHKVAGLQADAEAAASPEVRASLLNASIRLLGELNKTVLTLISYRSSLRKLAGRRPGDGRPGGRKPDSEKVSNREP